MGAVWMRFGAEARRRWRAWVGLALLFGIGAGAAIGAVAGARRSASAFPRFLQEQNAFHAMTGGGADDLTYPDRYAALKQHPMIAGYVETHVIGPSVTIPARRGRSERVISIPEAFPLVDPSGRAFYEVNRAKVLEGRLVDRASSDETMIPFTLAERHDIRIGDVLQVGVGFDVETFGPVHILPMRVVGIVASPGAFEAVGQTTIATVYVPPPLFERFEDDLPRLNGTDILIPDFNTLGVYLKGGAAAGTAFKTSVERDLNIDVPMVAPVVTSGVQKAMRLYSDALWLVAVLIAIATVTIAGQTLARQQMIESSDYVELSALGLSRGQLAAIGMLRAIVIGGVAAVTSIAVAFLLSPLMPIGTPRIAEPDPGFAFDGLAVGLGAAATLLLVPLLAAIPSWRAAFRSSAAGRSTAGVARPSRLAVGASRASRSPATVAGLRLALEPGRGRTAVPIRSTILSVAFGVAAVVGALVVGKSLIHLIATPELTGFTYDAIVPPAEQPPLPDEVVIAKLRAFPFVEETTTGTGLNVNFRGVDSFVIVFDQRGPIPFATISGRPPTDEVSDGLPEIAVGPATSRRLGLEVGDAVPFTFAGEGYAEPREVRARIVGLAAIPALPWAATEPGEGGVMTIGGLRSFAPGEPAGCCYVLFKDGTDLAAAEGALEEEGFDVFIRTERSDLATLERISRLPIALSIVFALIAAAALVHVLVTAIRRRRRDLAILKTLGFVTGQVRGAVAWQATTISVLAIVVGIPAGIALGRWGWRLVANQFGVVPASVAPAVVIALLVPGAVVLANVAAAIPGRIAARTQPAIVLRTE